MKKILISLIILFLPIIIGTIIGMNIDTNIYQNLNKPLLSPPGIVFPIVWSILYILLGISSTIIYNSNSYNKNYTLLVYFLGLILNFLWPLIFFNGQLFLFAYIILIFIMIFTIKTIIEFNKINKISSYLLIPYFFWLIFALYLNLGVYLLN